MSAGRKCILEASRRIQVKLKGNQLSWMDVFIGYDSVNFEAQYGVRQDKNELSLTLCSKQSYIADLKLH